jgi:hypothetical protein
MDNCVMMDNYIIMDNYLEIHFYKLKNQEGKLEWIL